MVLPNRVSPRAQWHDYGSPGGYFVTICTQHREHYFGTVLDGKMGLNTLGYFCQHEIQNIAIQRPYAEIHASIVMPNHVHVLLIVTSCRDASLMRPDGLLNRPYKGPTLGSIVKLFKGNVTKYAQSNNISFSWQSRYHDHIIRNEQEYEQIKRYIINNPQKWSEDTFYS